MNHVAFYQVEHVVRAVIDANIPPVWRSVSNIVVSDHVAYALPLPIAKYYGHRPGPTKDIIFDQIPTTVIEIQTFVVWPFRLGVMYVAMAILAADGFVRKRLTGVSVSYLYIIYPASPCSS